MNEETVRTSANPKVGFEGGLIASRLANVICLSVILTSYALFP